MASSHPIFLRLTITYLVVVIFGEVIGMWKSLPCLSLVLLTAVIGCGGPSNTSTIAHSPSAEASAIELLNVSHAQILQGVALRNLPLAILSKATLLLRKL